MWWASLWPWPLPVVLWLVCQLLSLLVHFVWPRGLRVKIKFWILLKLSNWRLCALPPPFIPPKIWGWSTVHKGLIGSTQHEVPVCWGTALLVAPVQLCSCCHTAFTVSACPSRSIWQGPTERRASKNGQTLNSLSSGFAVSAENINVCLRECVLTYRVPHESILPSWHCLSEWCRRSN